MKILRLLPLIGSFCLAGCSEDVADYVEPEGLYLGYSFESIPDDFRIYAIDNYVAEWTQEDAFDGSGSLKISSTDREGTIYAFWNLRLYDLPVGKTFSIRVKAKSKEISGEGWTVTMVTRSSDETLTEFAGIGLQRSTDDWEEYTLSFSDPIPEGIDHMDFYFLLMERTSGVIYFDKLELVVE